MSVSINRVTIAGNLSRDPEIKEVSSGRVVATFAIAINRRWRTDNGEQREDVTFVDCQAWGRTGELVGQYLAKGSPCLVEGHLRMEQWQDREGKNRERLRVVADSVQFLGTRPQASNTAPVHSSERGGPAAPSRSRASRRVQEAPSLDESVLAGGGYQP